MAAVRVALSRVQPAVAGVASSLLNTGQQVGGSIGLAVLGTVAWTAVANSIRSQSATAAAAAARAGHPVHQAVGGPLPAAIYRHALATGFSRGFEVSAGMLLLALIITMPRSGYGAPTWPAQRDYGGPPCVTPHACPEPSGRTPVSESRGPLCRPRALRRSSPPRGCALSEEGRNECLSWCTDDIRGADRGLGTPAFPPPVLEDRRISGGRSRP